MGQMLLQRSRRICLTVLALAVAGCGNVNDQAGAGGPSGTSSPLIEAASTKQNAARFLTQATFGPTDASVLQVQALGYRGWLDQQMATPSSSHLAYVDNRFEQIRLANPTAALDATHFYESFWLYAATSPAQLRERMKLALSEIFVISLADPVVEIRGAASYYDMLGNNAFGNYRTLLEQVSLHPMMGVYLTHMGNQKEDPATGRSPDENYSREVMQLMSIGVEQLNPDGTVRRDANGAAIPSYTSADITEMAKVFTGFSWYHPTPSNNTFLGRNRDPESAVRSMIPYANYHSTNSKTFLGKTIPAGSTDARAELNEALDVLFNHPNTGPFLARRLIQRLVTSNPSPAYVGRVAAVFNNNGQGVRGDLAAVTRAILLDREASTVGTGPGSGKVREPMIRLTNWMRAFEATSVSGRYLVGSTRANVSLAQAPLTAPSVFNFFRPGYVPPNTRLGAASLTAPEFQIVDEVSVAGYANTMLGAIGNGIGTGTDVRATYAREVAIAHDANALADRMNAILLYGQMSGRLRQRIIDSVNSVAIPGGTATAAQINTARLNRARIAIYLTMISPEYLVQR
ncbi:MAG: DUF1800 domain-containing protein [Alphaproteobacteria bacterium]|nr:MAG: DUF1800 domain-containing protein [Alphaproteobacteria bacterium]PZO39720.1 MAG: DUF1800 domain-containing protein [Alphaproteobacteria bacterium]